ncbi:MAG TPA: hypothetical protein VFY40_29055, partial [Blastocatellia bacterium]|nr:hypothetical protein [Blastocatellia bacterium]
YRNEDMNSDKPDTWGILSLFPLVYYGLLASYSLFHIFALGRYEPKDGQWGSFQMELLINGVATCVSFMGYLIGVGLVNKAVQRLPRQTLYLIMTTSAFLSIVVYYIVIVILDSHIELPVHIYLGVCGGGLLLIPALIGASLVKTGQICLARRQSIQR